MICDHQHREPGRLQSRLMIPWSRERNSNILTVAQIGRILVGHGAATRAFETICLKTLTRASSASCGAPSPTGTVTERRRLRLSAASTLWRTLRVYPRRSNLGWSACFRAPDEIDIRLYSLCTARARGGLGVCAFRGPPLFDFTLIA